MGSWFPRVQDVGILRHHYARILRVVFFLVLIIIGVVFVSYLVTMGSLSRPTGSGLVIFIFFAHQNLVYLLPDLLFVKLLVLF